MFKNMLLDLSISYVSKLFPHNNDMFDSFVTHFKKFYNTVSKWALQLGMVENNGRKERKEKEQWPHGHHKYSIFSRSPLILYSLNTRIMVETTIYQQTLRL
jgi:hypothetical protein